MPEVGAKSVFWLEQALSRVATSSCPPLTGRVHADICIVGGGYTGLWTALEIADQAPDTRVVLIESQACGFGASGRNGGWATSWYDELGPLIKRFGQPHALWLAKQSSAAIGRLGDFLGEQGYGDTFRREGTIWVASGPGQENEIESAAATLQEHGHGGLIEEIGPSEIAAITGYRGSSGGVLIRDSASVQPGILVRALREEAIRRGITIYESTPMMEVERKGRPVVTTPAGQIEADVVVIATNAWAAEMRELRRSILAVASQIVLTEPLGDRIDALEWSQGALLGDARLFVHYAQVTTDGRIAFGRGGGAVGRGGRVLTTHFDDPKAIAAVSADFRRWFPQLADVRLTHAWSGPVDRAPGHLPFIGSLGDREAIHYGLGYSGNGVAPSALIGRILGRRALGIEDEFTTCGLVSGPPGYLPPEPFRHAGAAIVQSALHLAESRQNSGRRVGLVGKTAKRLTSFSTPRLWR